MAISTYSSLLQTLANYLARTDLSSTGTGSVTTPLQDAVTLFEAEANRTLRVREQIVTQSTTPSSGQFDLPSDYLQWLRVTWTGDPRTELEYVHPSYLQSHFVSGDTGPPSCFTVEGSTSATSVVRIAPTDTSAVNFVYYQKVTALSTSNTTNWLLTAHPDIYLAGAMTEACVYTKDYDTAAIWKTRRDDLFERIAKLDARTKAPSYIRVPGVNP